MSTDDDTRRRTDGRRTDDGPDRAREKGIDGGDARDGTVDEDRARRGVVVA
jgi:hypothetical protein